MFKLIIVGILVLLFLYFALWLLITGLIGAVKMFQSKKWVETTGKIINTEIKYKDFGGGESTKSRRFVKIKTYIYVFKNKYFTSNNTFSSDYLYEKEYKSIQKNASKQAINQLVTSLNLGEIKFDAVKGERTKVYVNPKNPKNACLETSFQKEIFLPIFMGLLLASGIAYVVVYFLTEYFK